MTMVARIATTVSHERCWRFPCLPGVVMFKGHYTHDFIPHCHDVVTVVLVTEGSYLLNLNGGDHVVGKGELVLIGAHQVHGALPISRQGWDMMTMHVPPEFLFGDSCVNEEGCSVGFLSPVHAASPELTAAFLAAHRHDYKEEAQFSQISGIMEFFDMLKSVLRDYRPSHLRRPNCPEVKRAEDLITSAFRHDVLIDDVAERIGLSTFALIRRFKRSHGLAPHAWRMQMRAREVARLLHSKTELADIAFDCGFSDQAHMTRVFKRVFGVTPGQYRQVH